MNAKTRRFTTIGVALLGGALMVGVAAPAMAAPEAASANTPTTTSQLKNFWARGVAITIHNQTTTDMKVQDLTTAGQPTTVVHPGDKTTIKGDVVDNDGKSINFGTARVTTSQGTYLVQGMNGQVLCPSFQVDKNGKRVWSAGGFWEQESKSATIDGQRFDVKRLADDQPGFDYAKHFQLIITHR